LRNVLAHFPEKLGVISGESTENNHANDADDHGHYAGPYEQVHQHGNDNADQAHEEEAAPRGQVFLGIQSVKAHSAEHARGGNKGVGHGSARISRQHIGQPDAIEYAVQ
jgi:hypothetical protein